MPLLYFSPINFSRGAITALSALVKPYGQGVTLNSATYTNSVAANLQRRILQAVILPGILLKSSTVNNLFSPITLFAAKMNVALKLNVCDSVTKVVPASALPGYARCVSIPVNQLPNNVTEFGSRVGSLQVNSTTVRAAVPSTLLDIPNS
jgi:hypothetical protein